MSPTKCNEPLARLRRRRLGLYAPRAARRGVLLLVILSMLVVFLMTAVAFVVVARHYDRASKATGRIEKLDPPAQELLDAALHDLVRDTKNPHSRVRFHSLLQDMYGTDGFVAEVWRPTTGNVALDEQLAPKYVEAVKSNDLDELLGTTVGQIIEFAIYQDSTPASSPFPENPKDLFQQPHDLPVVEGYYNGHVLTWTSGPLTGQSMRVVGYRSQQISGAPVFFLQVLATGSEGLGPFTPTARNDPDQARRVRSPEIKELVRFPFSPQAGDQNGGHRFVVNGRPFNGTGAGYNRLNPDGILSNAMVAVAGVPYPLALLPNPAFFAPTDVVLPSDPAVPSVYAQYFLTDGQIATVQASGLPPAQQAQLLRQLSEARGLAGLGGLDEGYDALDYQNMLLGYVPINPTIPSGFTTAAGGTGPAYTTLADPSETDRIVQPSLHRTALINYLIKEAPDETARNARWNAWHLVNDRFRLNTTPALMAEKALGRQAILRPMPFDHPYFPPISNLIYGPWDVDNDGDGVPDSIWVDLGYPPVKTADGRYYKPMFAILVQDLDGRLNVSAHGSLQEAVVGRSQHENQVVLATDTTATPPQNASQLAPGIGYGPAEISLYPLLLAANLGNQAAATLQYQQLLRGQMAGNNLLTPGRYGRNQLPGAGAMWDLRAQMKFREYPLIYQRPPFSNNVIAQRIRRAFSSPPDLMGRFGLGIDFTGFPNFAIYADASESVLAESPYEKNLLQEGPRTVLEQSAPGGMVVGEDAQFTVAELEELLRRFDADVGQLPSRLTALAGSLFDAARAVTTRSFDLPVPSVAPLAKQVERFRIMQGRGVQEFEPDTQAQVERLVMAPRNVEELLIGHLMLEMAINDSQPLDQTDLALAVESARRLVSADLRDNLRLDINRPFGNGRDDDGDGAVDDPDEARQGLDVLVGPLRNGTPLQSESVAPNDAARAYQPTARMDVARRDNDEIAAGPLPPAEIQANARQYTARELFVLLMLLKDEDYFFEFADELIESHDPRNPEPNDEYAMTARRLAQWAVNAVDFRDADAIMTGFEVDLQPFVDNDGDPTNGTWDVDGDLRTPEPAGTNGFEYRVVLWGLERPQALITETLATHDLRLIDSQQDSGARKRRDGNNSGDYDDPAEDDDDLDQFRIPQGSLFLELYCTGNPTNNVQPGELYRYDQNIGKWMLNLAQTPLTPHPRTGQPDPNPVWRLAISEPHVQGLHGDERDTSVYERFLANPETISFQPENMGLMTNPAGDYRYVWFTDNSMLGNVRVPEPERIFWNTEPVGYPAAVPAGQYAVIGPREETYFGSLGTGATREPAEQRITLEPFRVMFDPDDQDTLTRFNPSYDIANGGRGDGRGNVKAAHGIVIGMQKEPAGWTREANIGLNISEPLPGVTGQYYPQPDEQLANYPADETDAYGNETNAASVFPDQPFDLRNGAPISELAGLIGTHEEVRTVFLQRLADPTMPWNPAPDDPKYGTAGTWGPGGTAGDFYEPALPVNPYITVDWQPLDLTVFNGEDPGPPAGWEDGDDDRESKWVANLHVNSRVGTRLSTRERGLVEPGQLTAHNLWRAESSRELRSAAPIPGTMAYFKYPLQHSLGYVNSTYGIPVQLPNNYQQYRVPGDPRTAPTARALALGAPAEPMPPGGPAGTPPTPKPFPWLAWNDRPYVSELELLQVPISEPGRLTVEHTMATQDNTFDPYDADSFAEEFERAWDGNGSLIDPNDRGQPDRMYRYSNGNSTFGHLLNFQAATNPRDTAGTPPQPKPAPNFAGLLEYVAVPSRFVGTETFLNPEVFSTLSAGSEYRRPPFNRISQYREPGQINLNTIFNELVYQGLFHGDPETAGTGTTPPAHPGAEWDEFVKSRRGYQMSDPVLDISMYALHDEYPTHFAGLYGPPEAGHLVPLGDAIPAGTASDEIDGLTDMRRGGTDTGLLRRDLVDAPQKPLFRDHNADSSPNMATNPHKHSYFHYQAAQRLANLTTSRSNVYAVWVTVGFFEMAPVDDAHREAMIDDYPQALGGPTAGQALFDRLYPEGMWLGPEAGSDTGQTQRYRAFYIIDRSVPVAYEPGQNHNIENAIILRRRLE